MSQVVNSEDFRRAQLALLPKDAVAAGFLLVLCWLLLSLLLHPQHLLNDPDKKRALSCRLPVRSVLILKLSKLPLSSGQHL